MKITDKEVWLIENVISGEFTSNNYHLPSPETPYEEAFTGEVWSDTIELGGAKHGTKTSGKELSGVASSLVKKGYAYSTGKGKDSGFGITKEGWLAYQEWAKENLK